MQHNVRDELVIDFDAIDRNEAVTVSLERNIALHYYPMGCFYGNIPVMRMMNRIISQLGAGG